MRIPAKSIMVFCCLLSLIKPGWLLGQVPFDPRADQSPLSTAQAFFDQAFQAECAVFRQNNPTEKECGVDTLRRNVTLKAWGATYPVAGTTTAVTRYNPNDVAPGMVRFGADAGFFIFAHEIGHHFDIQFPGARTPWGRIVYPPGLGLQAQFTDNWTLELNADAWGACAAALSGRSVLGADAIQILGAMDAWPTLNPDVPPPAAAQAAISQGYSHCDHGAGAAGAIPAEPANPGGSFRSTLTALVASADAFPDPIPDLPFQGQRFPGTLSEGNPAQVDYEILTQEMDEAAARNTYRRLLQATRSVLTGWTRDTGIDIVNGVDETQFSKRAGSVEVYLQRDPSWGRGQDKYEVHLVVIPAAP